MILFINHETLKVTREGCKLLPLACKLSSCLAASMQPTLCLHLSSCVAVLMLHIHAAGQKAAAYIPGTDANRESKDRQYEEGYRSTPGTGSGDGYGTATSGYSTGGSQNTSGTASMTAGEPDLNQPCCSANFSSEAHMQEVCCNHEPIVKEGCPSCPLDAQHQHPDYQ